MTHNIRPMEDVTSENQELRRRLRLANQRILDYETRHRNDLQTIETLRNRLAAAEGRGCPGNSVGTQTAEYVPFIDDVGEPEVAALSEDAEVTTGGGTDDHLHSSNEENDEDMIYLQEERARQNRLRETLNLLHNQNTMPSNLPDSDDGSEMKQKEALVEYLSRDSNDRFKGWKNSQSEETYHLDKVSDINPRQYYRNIEQFKDMLSDSLDEKHQVGTQGHIVRPDQLSFSNANLSSRTVRVKNKSLSKARDSPSERTNMKKKTGKSGEFFDRINIVLLAAAQQLLAGKSKTTEDRSSTEVDLLSSINEQIPEKPNPVLKENGSSDAIYFLLKNIRKAQEILTGVMDILDELRSLLDRSEQNGLDSDDIAHIQKDSLEKMLLMFKSAERQETDDMAVALKILLGPLSGD